MGIIFDIHDLVNVIHKVIVECVKIYSHFPRIAINIHVIHMKHVEILPCIYVVFLYILSSIYIFNFNSFLLAIKRIKNNYIKTRTLTNLTKK